MTFGTIGFGAVQIQPSPQVFQALSLGGAPPLPPAPPYGNPNPNLVPVTQTGNPAVPANLTLAAHPAFAAILKLTNQSVLAFAHPPLPATTNTTSAVSATNPGVSGLLQGPSPTGIPGQADVPAGPVSFQLTVAPANLTSGSDALQQTLAKLQQGEQAAAAASAVAAATAPPSNANTSNASSTVGTNPGSAPIGVAPAPAPAPAPVIHGSTTTTPATASPGLVAKIVQTVQSLAIGTVYSAPVFSFSA
jgi:hypothetical protein